MGYTVSKVGTIFPASSAFHSYYPCVINTQSIPNFPWDITILASTDHSSTGGIYISGLRSGEDPALTSSYETYNAALARGAFDSFPTKPAANPVYTNTDAGYSSPETPWVNQVGAEFIMTLHVGVDPVVY